MPRESTDTENLFGYLLSTLVAANDRCIFIPHEAMDLLKGYSLRVKKEEAGYRVSVLTPEEAEGFEKSGGFN